MLPAKEKVEVHDDLECRWTTADLKEMFLVHTSLPTTDETCRAMILSLLDAEAIKGGELIGEEFKISDYIVHAFPVVTPEGEEVNVRRIVFPQDEGKPIAFVSEGVIKSIQRIAWAVGSAPPWDPPVKVVLRQRNTGQGRRYYLLQLSK